MKEIYNGYELQTEWDDEASMTKRAWRFPKAQTHIFMKRTH